jgi:hypothetical protein
MANAWQIAHVESNVNHTHHAKFDVVWVIVSAVRFFMLPKNRSCPPRIFLQLDRKLAQQSDDLLQLNASILQRALDKLNCLFFRPIVGGHFFCCGLYDFHVIACL